VRILACLPGYSSASQAPIARARLKFILGKTGYSRIADPANEVLISAIVSWEISKMPPHVLVTDFLLVLRKEAFTFLEIHPLHAIRSGMLPFHHRDPFDRLLAAQSLELGVPLTSIDTIFDRYGVERIW